MRVRIYFAKTSAMQFTGHLDLYRTWERMMRRAGLPLAFTQGFNQHARINLASALPLGFTSEAEQVDVWLATPEPAGAGGEGGAGVAGLSPEAIEAALRVAAPPGIVIQRAAVVDDRAPTLQAILQATEYVMTLLDAPTDLDERVARLLGAESVRRERRGKAYNLRPLVFALVRLPDEDGMARLLARLSAREGATGRPEEVLLALGLDPLAARVHRTRLVFGEEG